MEYYSLSKKSCERKMSFYSKGLLARFTQLYQSVSNQDQKLNGVAKLSSNLKIPPVTFSALRLRPDPWLPMVYFLVAPMEEGASRKLHKGTLQCTVQRCLHQHSERVSQVDPQALYGLSCALFLRPTLVFPSASS